MTNINEQIALHHADAVDRVNQAMQNPSAEEESQRETREILASIAEDIAKDEIKERVTRYMRDDEVPMAPVTRGEVEGAFCYLLWLLGRTPHKACEKQARAGLKEYQKLEKLLGSPGVVL